MRTALAIMRFGQHKGHKGYEGPKGCSGRKGSVEDFFVVIGIMLVMLMIFLVLLSTSNELLGWDIAARQAGLGIRNNMLLMSSIEIGYRNYQQRVTALEPKVFDFIVNVNSENVTVQHEQSSNVFIFPHYVENVVPSGPIRGHRFCIIKKLNASCFPVVEVCKDLDTACCTIDSTGCLNKPI